jgi:hypothetical protein
VRDSLKRSNPEIRNVWLFDKQYCALTIKEFESVVKEIEPITVQFKDELFDCDDYALVTSAFMKLKAAALYPRSISFGEITIKHSLTGEVHSLNFLVTEDEKLHYWEPQGQLFVNGDNYKPFFVRI